MGILGVMECQEYVKSMPLESDDFHHTDVLRENNRILGKFVKNALFAVYDGTTFYRAISYA